MPSVALCAPAVRIVVVNAIYDSADRDRPPTVGIHPVVAIRTRMDDEGACKEDILVMIDEVVWELFDFFGDQDQFEFKAVVCPWPPAEDEARLEPIIVDLRTHLIERHENCSIED